MSYKLWFILIVLVMLFMKQKWKHSDQTPNDNSTYLTPIFRCPSLKNHRLMDFENLNSFSHPKSVLFLTSEIRNRDSHSGCGIFYPSTGKNTSCIGQGVSFLLLFKVASFKFFRKINYSDQIVPTVRDFQAKPIDIAKGVAHSTVSFD